MDGPPERGAPRGPTVAALPTSRAGSVLALLALAVAIVFLGFMLAALLGGGGPEGLLAGALLALGGPVVWGFLYGSDMALFMFLCLWLMERLLATWNGGPFAGTVVAGVLCALARPEGLPLAVLLG